MAKDDLNGRLQKTIDAMREEWEEHCEESKFPTEDLPDFEDKYCLAKIPRQPEEYTGPPRYCISRNVKKVGSAYRCKHHGGCVTPRPWNLTDGNVTNMKHGMHATVKNLMEDFDDKDEALYNWVVEEYPEAYDINIEEDPQSAYDLHRLAVEIVRAERGRGHLIEEGEVHEREIRDDEGKIVIDENGEIETEKSEHYLSGMLSRQDNKITKLEKELGISRKERLKRDTQDEAAETIAKGLGELGKAFIDKESKDYDPDEKPWKEDSDNEQDG